MGTSLTRSCYASMVSWKMPRTPLTPWTSPMPFCKRSLNRYPLSSLNSALLHQVLGREQARKRLAALTKLPFDNVAFTLPATPSASGRTKLIALVNRLPFWFVAHVAVLALPEKKVPLVVKEVRRLLAQQEDSESDENESWQAAFLDLLNPHATLFLDVLRKVVDARLARYLSPDIEVEEARLSAIKEKKETHLRDYCALVVVRGEKKILLDIKKMTED